MLRYPKVLLSIVAALGGGLLVLSLYPRDLETSPLQGDRIRVLLIGDSHSATGDEYVSGKEAGQSYRSYADQLALDLAASHTLINIGCPGSSLLDWTRDSQFTPCVPADRVVEGLFPTLAQPALPVAIVVVLLGTNDASGWYEPDAEGAAVRVGVPVTGEAYAAGLDALLGALRLGGAETIVLMTPPDRTAIGRDGDRERLLDYRETILDLCTHSEDLVCGPDLFTLLDAELDFAGIQLHFNARGHARIASALGEALLAIPEPTAPPL